MYAAVESSNSPNSLGLVHGLPHLMHNQAEDERTPEPCSPLQQQQQQQQQQQHIKLESEHNNNQSNPNGRTLYNLDQMVTIQYSSFLVKMSNQKKIILFF
jgi:hypothetical protein